jgi:hypothetical protein
MKEKDNNTDPPELLLPDYFDDRMAYEMTLKGWYPAEIRFSDGQITTFEFYDAVRLKQDIEEEFSQGTLFFAQTNIIIIPEVKIAAIKDVIEVLWRQGYFSNLKIKK